MASGLKGEAVLGRIPLAECNRSDMGDSRAHIVVVVDQVEVGANLMGKWAMWEDMKDAVAQGRNVRSGNWLAEVDLVVSEVEVVSQEAGRTGFDATEGSDLSCCDPLDEVEVDCCMAIDWVDELLVMRSFACRAPSAVSLGPAILYELQVGTMDQHWTTHHTNRLMAVLGHTQQHPAVLEQLA
jgi:hypothetical protein